MPSATSGSPEVDIAHNHKHMLISDFDFAVLKKVASGIYRNMIETNTFDADKLNKDKEENFPSKDYISLVAKGIRNIGKKDPLYKYLGYIGNLNNDRILKRLATRL